MKTLQKTMMILMVLVFALSMNSCKKNKARNCSAAAADYVDAMNRLSAGTATCEDVQKELKSLYKDCKAYMGTYSEDDINTMCDHR